MVPKEGGRGGADACVTPPTTKHSMWWVCSAKVTKPELGNHQSGIAMGCRYNAILAIAMCLLIAQWPLSGLDRRDKTVISMDGL